LIRKRRITFDAFFTTYKTYPSTTYSWFWLLHINLLLIYPFPYLPQSSEEVVVDTNNSYRCETPTCHRCSICIPLLLLYFPCGFPCGSYWIHKYNTLVHSWFPFCKELDNNNNIYSLHFIVLNHYAHHQLHFSNVVYSLPMLRFDVTRILVGKKTVFCSYRG
jgi:hypothetical protein